MNYLLDTHAFLWVLFDSKKLSKTVENIYLNSEDMVYVSLVSFWEISLKYGLGKIKLEKILPDDLPSIAQKAGLEILGIKASEVASFHLLPRTFHKDPFDRLIIWQSIQNNYTLFSKDVQFGQYRSLGLKVMW